MKKAFINFALLFLFSIIHLSAFELWNGFTTEMNKDQVLSKARIDLRVSQTPDEIIDSRYNRLIIYHDSYYYSSALRQGNSSDKILTNMVFLQYPLAENHQRLAVYSPLSEYRQITVVESKFVNNIIFYFYKNKLYSVEIGWTARPTDLINLANTNFGNYAAIVDQKAKDRTLSPLEETFYVWKLNNRLIYIKGTQGLLTGTMYIVDRSVIENWISEKERVEQQQRAEEQEAASKVRF